MGFVLLALVTAFALTQRHEPLTRAALVVLANSAIMSFWFWLVERDLVGGLHVNPIVQLVVDIASAYIIMRDPAGRVQGWLGLLFGARIGASLAFIHVGNDLAEHDYWERLNFAGVAILIGIFLWSAGHGDRFSRLIRWMRGALLVAQSRSGVGRRDRQG